MILVVDIGNSTVVAGPPDGIRERWPTHGTDPRQAVSDLVAALAERNPGRPRLVALSSVVPAVTPAWRAALSAICGDVRQAGVELPLPLRVDYATPATLGVDRVLSAAGAARLHGAPVLVAGCGTATTLDVVDRDGVFRGGAILCGLALQRDALASGTAQLPAVPLDPPARAVGRSTVECLQSGLVYGHAAAVAGLAARMRAELDLPEAPLIGTGGLAPVLASAAPELFTAVWPELVLGGLTLAASRVLEDGG